ncbi:MAG TPA: hypothetical protein VE057_08095 [Archangium sp.]|nr:hypothetical protein [Archangium sp.]
MELHTFPFDVQDLDIVIEDGESDASELEWVLESHGTGDVQTLRERNELDSPEEVFDLQRAEFPEWKVLAIHAERGRHVYSFLGDMPFMGWCTATGWPSTSRTSTANRALTTE